jgi:hypothetical protein
MMIWRPLALVPPAGLAVTAGIVFGLIAYADAAGIDPALLTGPVVWTCQNPW